MYIKNRKQFAVTMLATPEEARKLTGKGGKAAPQGARLTD
jgi:hypothetical protein